MFMSLSSQNADYLSTNKVRILRDDMGTRPCDFVRMARTRKSKADLSTLEVDFIPEDFTPPPHHMRAWREKKELTQEQLAELMGTTKGVVSDLENSKRELGTKWLWKISTALRIRPGYILEHDPATLPDDIIEIWATIKDDDRPKAIRALKVFESDTGT
ncbi:MAG: helix-turn-helix transcriptional regulator [Asticcacaulis sp.]|uniref:helix-turn-helix domain-containing protein n=1 Tax=Asticcacaulis sp. TaxID=1872648 RepID=UPI0039E2CB85